MNGWLLDTNVLFEIARRDGSARVLHWAARQQEHRTFISVLTLAEFDKGIHNLAPGSSLRLRIEADLRALEGRFSGRVISVSDAVVRRWGRISGAVLQAKGRAPPIVDTLLAATAIEHDLMLATRNVKDVRDTGARVFDPWLDSPPTE